MTTYRVMVTRQDGAWFADVGGLPPNLVAATDVPRFADLDVEVRDLVAGLLDVDPESFELEWAYLFGDADMTKTVADLDEVVSALQEMEARRDTLRADLIRAGRAAGLSQAAIADVVGVSQQRVAQLSRAS
jgi:predicted XRE-type DNA-binding protein